MIFIARNQKIFRIVGKQIPINSSASLKMITMKSTVCTSENKNKKTAKFACNFNKKWIIYWLIMSHQEISVWL
jgi:hypothetical protein